MAQKATKNRAKSNAASLRDLHLGSLIVNAAFLIFYLIFRSRSLLAYFIMSIPAFLCQFMLERTGRPKYDAQTGALRSSGEDLANAGLTEYMFDTIWITWFTVILVILFGNKLWFFWAVVPVFAAYKGYGMLGAARQMAGLQGMANAAGGGMPPAGNRKQRRAA